MAFGLQVSDDGFDGGAATQLALDNAEDAALLAGDEDATGILCVVAAVSLVDIGPLDRAAGECSAQAAGINKLVGRVSVTQCKKVSVSLPLTGDSHGYGFFT